MVVLLPALAEEGVEELWDVGFEQVVGGLEEVIGDVAGDGVAVDEGAGIGGGVWVVGTEEGEGEDVSRVGVMGVAVGAASGLDEGREDWEGA
ncbi:MAG: hypothetical protein C4296_07285 [Gemmataceae bacterium]